MTLTPDDDADIRNLLAQCRRRLGGPAMLTIPAVLGLSSAGGTLVPVNTRFKGPEAADILRRSGARALVTVTDFLGSDYAAMLRDEDSDLAALATVVVASGPPGPGTASWAEFVAAATPAAHKVEKRALRDL